MGGLGIVMLILLLPRPELLLYKACHVWRHLSVVAVDYLCLGGLHFDFAPTEFGVILGLGYLHTIWSSVGVHIRPIFSCNYVEALYY